MPDPYKLITEEEFESVMKKISNIDYGSITVAEVVSIITPLLKGLSFTAIQTASGLALYRGVKWDDKPTTISQISYPSISNTKINRASDKGEQMFYASTSKNITLYEMNLKKGDKLIISQWRSEINLIFILLGYTEGNLKRMGAKRIVDLGNIRFNSEELMMKTKLSVKSIEFLSETFCQLIPINNEDRYKLTIAISKLLLRDQYRDFEKSDGEFNGIVYPSVKGGGDCDNYAIRINVVDNHFLNLYDVEFIEIIEYNLEQRKYLYRILDYADSFLKNQILWKNLTNSWTLWDDQEIYFDESIPIRAFTTDGEEYLPSPID